VDGHSPNPRPEQAQQCLHNNSSNRTAAWANTHSKSSLHMLVEEGDDFFGMPSEAIVTVLEAPGGALDPEQFLLFAAEQVEGLLRIFGIPDSGVL
jgi:hypothetical protein